MSDNTSDLIKYAKNKIVYIIYNSFDLVPEYAALSRQDQFYYSYYEKLIVNKLLEDPSRFLAKTDNLFKFKQYSIDLYTNIVNNLSTFFKITYDIELSKEEISFIEKTTSDMMSDLIKSDLTRQVHSVFEIKTALQKAFNKIFNASMFASKLVNHLKLDQSTESKLKNELQKQFNKDSESLLTRLFDNLRNYRNFDYNNLVKYNTDTYQQKIPVGNNLDDKISIFINLAYNDLINLCGYFGDNRNVSYLNKFIKAFLIGLKPKLKKIILYYVDRAFEEGADYLDKSGDLVNLVIRERYNKYLKRIFKNALNISEIVDFYKAPNNVKNNVKRQLTDIFMDKMSGFNEMLYNKITEENPNFINSENNFISKIPEYFVTVNRNLQARIVECLRLVIIGYKELYTFFGANWNKELTGEVSKELTSIVPEFTSLIKNNFKR